MDPLSGKGNGQDKKTDSPSSSSSGSDLPNTSDSAESGVKPKAAIRPKNRRREKNHYYEHLTQRRRQVKRVFALVRPERIRHCPECKDIGIISPVVREQFHEQKYYVFCKRAHICWFVRQYKGRAVVNTEVLTEYGLPDKLEEYMDIYDQDIAKIARLSISEYIKATFLTSQTSLDFSLALAYDIKKIIAPFGSFDSIFHPPKDTTEDEPVVDQSLKKIIASGFYGLEGFKLPQPTKSHNCQVTPPKDEEIIKKLHCLGKSKETHDSTEVDQPNPNGGEPPVDHERQEITAPGHSSPAQPAQCELKPPDVLSKDEVEIIAPDKSCPARPAQCELKPPDVLNKDEVEIIAPDKSCPARPAQCELKPPDVLNKYEVEIIAPDESCPARPAQCELKLPDVLNKDEVEIIAPDKSCPARPAQCELKPPDVLNKDEIDGNEDIYDPAEMIYLADDLKELANALVSDLPIQYIQKVKSAFLQIDGFSFPDDYVKLLISRKVKLQDIFMKKEAIDEDKIDQLMNIFSIVDDFKDLFTSDF